MTVVLAQTASYVDDNAVNWEMEPPEYAVIPWGEHRSGRLTVKLALWFLAMMAANGGCDIDYSYPALGSFMFSFLQPAC